MPKPEAKPKIVSNIGYTSNGRTSKQVLIATSNLFIETGSVDVDAMTAAIFDSIAGNELINISSSSIILQESNSLIENSGYIIDSTNGSSQLKSGEGSSYIATSFQLSLKNYLPKAIANEELIGNLAYPFNLKDFDVYANFLERNVYFDETYENIIIELNNLSNNQVVEVEFVTSNDPTSAII